MQRVKVRITDGCWIAGQVVSPGEILELDALSAHGVLSSGRAELIDADDIRRHCGPPIIAWKQDEGEAARSFKRVT